MSNPIQMAWIINPQMLLFVKLLREEFEEKSWSKKGILSCQDISPLVKIQELKAGPYTKF